MFCPLGIVTPSEKRLTGSSRPNLPSSTSCNRTLMTNVFVLAGFADSTRTQKRTTLAEQRRGFSYEPYCGVFMADRSYTTTNVHGYKLAVHEYEAQVCSDLNGGRRFAAPLGSRGRFETLIVRDSPVTSVRVKGARPVNRRDLLECHSKAYSIARSVGAGWIGSPAGALETVVTVRSDAVPY